MEIEQLQPGDIIYAAADIYNDGSIPDMSTDELVANAGSRGVLINIGHIEGDESVPVYLVRFEQNGELGPPIGCWEAELTADCADGGAIASL